MINTHIVRDVVNIYLKSYYMKTKMVQRYYAHAVMHMLE